MDFYSRFAGAYPTPNNQDYFIERFAFCTAILMSRYGSDNLEKNTFFSLEQICRQIAFIG